MLYQKKGLAQRKLCFIKIPICLIEVLVPWPTLSHLWDKVCAVLGWGEMKLERHRRSLACVIELEQKMMGEIKGIVSVPWELLQNLRLIWRKNREI